MNRVQTDPRLFLPFLPFVILLASESLKCGSTGKSAIREPDSVAMGAPWCAAVNSRSKPWSRKYWVDLSSVDEFDELFGE